MPLGELAAAATPLLLLLLLVVVVLLVLLLTLLKFAAAFALFPKTPAMVVGVAEEWGVAALLSTTAGVAAAAAAAEAPGITAAEASPLSTPFLLAALEGELSNLTATFNLSSLTLVISFCIEDCFFGAGLTRGSSVDAESAGEVPEGGLGLKNPMDDELEASVPIFDSTGDGGPGLPVWEGSATVAPDIGGSLSVAELPLVYPLLASVGGGMLCP
mmetsp:Transcript_27216/g.50176  ORF Transcript_27216/g.50176 Transcript_27216/m.50176 type:complete len:215 (+) Transcript_27216:1325-1969(+)